LLKQWLANSIKIHFSVEYYYFNYNVDSGIEYIQSPIIFNALTALNSEDRGNAIEVLPAYDCATLTSFNELKDQWNKAINSLNKNEKENNSLQSSENLDSNKLKQTNNIQKEEIQDMENIFSDFEIIALEKDTQVPGVFIKVRKPMDYEENELIDYTLYNIVSNKKVKTLDQNDFNSIYFKKLLLYYKLNNCKLSIYKYIMNTRLYKYIKHK
jgi:hypothetical protein